MRIAALMIGRGGSSLKDKNILPVHGVPLLLWAAAAAVRSKHVNAYYVSSDCDRILATAARAGYKPIIRPAELASATAQSSDAVRHAMEFMEQDGGADIVVVQHANVGTISAQQIDDCIEILLANPEATAVVPAHEMQDYHPYRGKAVGEGGFLTPFCTPASGVVSANRQDLPKCLHFDHSFWVLRGRKAIFDPNGQPPWVCMGSHILPYETEGCFDVHSVEDLGKTEKWIDRHGIPRPEF